MRVARAALLGSAAAYSPPALVPPPLLVQGKNEHIQSLVMKATWARRPVLLCTTSIEESEEVQRLLGEMLTESKLPRG